MDNSRARCSAFDKAVNLLAFKDRTTQEITHKLKEKGYSSDEIDEAVEKLTYYGYLNDQNYTISFIKDNASKKGKNLIISQLNQKGVNREIASELCQDLYVDEVPIIEEQLKRRYSTADFNDDKVYRRVVGYFLRRGFKYDNIQKVLRNKRKLADSYYC